jgi:RhtB (resistance to homoserine/threonine) family protein
MAPLSDTIRENTREKERGTMLGTVNFSVFVISGILLNITPGSDTMYILSRSISFGRRAGILSVLGISSGAVIHTLLAALGLSAILAQSAFAFNVVKYAGSIYLLYLGIKAILTKYEQSTLSNSVEETTSYKIYVQGLLTNLLNPKVALFFLTFLPQFVDPKTEYGALSFLLLGVTYLTTGTIWCLLLAMFSSMATKTLRDNQKISTVLNKSAGVIYMLLGLNLLRSKA